MGNTTSRGYTNSKVIYNDALWDVYSPEKAARSRAEWEIPTDEKSTPYLKHVKDLSAGWPHLRLLADFMEVSTTPARWTDFKEGRRTGDERQERAKRTNVTRLDYFDSNRVVPNICNTPDALRNALKEDDDQCHLRLYVVEDLSRAVIELVGTHLDIEPAFFREHIVNYAWCNARDRWANPPNLNVVAREQRWVQLRFVTARYFKTANSFMKACKEAEFFNVLRGPDDDQNNKALMDDKNAIVGLTRTMASFWLKSADKSQKKGAIGVLLLDPTIKEGQPLWYGYRNWKATPSVGTAVIPPHPPRDSLFNELIYWAQKPEAFNNSSLTNLALNIHMPVQALLHLICAEWLTVVDYIKTRLNEAERDLSFPEQFLNQSTQIEVGLKKLVVWRRLVPLYREMLTETLQRVFHFPCHTDGTGSVTPCPCALHQPTEPVKQGPINIFRDDFTRALSYMEEYQQRINNLTQYATAMTSICDSRRSQDDNRNIARLTWLATFFIPLSFVASLFSMQNDLSTLRETYKIYFAVALPLAAGLVVILALPIVHWSGVFIRHKKSGPLSMV